MLMDMCIPKFDIYQSAVTPNYFKSLKGKADIVKKPVN